jgi:chromosome condensin MukBEF ATPase and DNA-binding subunit MukB
MSGREELLRALLELEALQTKSRALRPDQKHDILAMRRLIAEQNARISPLGDTAFERTEDRDAFRREHSTLRAAIAHHMASWPVVAIDLGNPAYIASLGLIREAYQSFFSWVRNARSGS